MIPPVSSSPQAVLQAQIDTLQAKLTKLDADPKTRGTMLAAVTAATLREVQAELRELQ